MNIEALLIISIALNVIIIILFFVFKPKAFNLTHFDSNFQGIEKNQNQFKTDILNEFKSNREETNKISKSNRDELNNSFKDLKKELSDSLEKLNKQQSDEAEKSRNQIRNSLKDFQEDFAKNVKSFNDLQKEKFDGLEKRQNKLVESTEKKLEQMRETVDEKLQKTLNDRISKSFEQVGKRLESVQKGLGEMQTLAQDVGGLKRVLSNVKMRGGIGEVQLAMLLENILAPDQYEPNVKTKKGSDSIVEFAVKLPGKDETKSHIWLPIDAKFPKDAYEYLQNAYDEADPKVIETAQKNLDTTIKNMAKDIATKYIDPPNTTDFAIMFLPFEGLYAEVVRKAALLEEIQRSYNVLVTGPTTLAAILNSLQMGFKTLAIEKRSSEVWKVLGAVKTEFENFGGMLKKAQKNIQTGLNQLDDVRGVRTRAINRKLRTVESLDQTETQLILPELSNAQEDIEEEEI